MELKNSGDGELRSWGAEVPRCWGGGALRGRGGKQRGLSLKIQIQDEAGLPTAPSSFLSTAEPLSASPAWPPPSCLSHTHVRPFSFSRKALGCWPLVRWARVEATRQASRVAVGVSTGHCGPSIPPELP